MDVLHDRYDKGREFEPRENLVFSDASFLPVLQCHLTQINYKYIHVSTFSFKLYFFILFIHNIVFSFDFILIFYMYTKFTSLLCYLQTHVYLMQHDVKIRTKKIKK